MRFTAVGVGVSGTSTALVRRFRGVDGASPVSSTAGTCATAFRLRDAAGACGGGAGPGLVILALLTMAATRADLRDAILFVSIQPQNLETL